MAYLRSQPAVERDLPETDLNILAALIVRANMAPTAVQPRLTAPVVAPPDVTPEYGQYLVYTSGCRDCHGADLTGGTNPFIPSGPNLTTSMPGWSEAQFITFLHTGVNTTGRTIEQLSMPWQSYNKVFSDAELRDIYNYLRRLPVVEIAK
jgi:mono/diheme cytochrome c family protein